MKRAHTHVRSLVLLAVTTVALGVSSAAHATPSTTYWAPSTPYMQPFGVLHVTYDSYFNDRAAYPVDLGLTMGVLPWKEFQLEVGFDAFYPTINGTDPVAFPIVLNAKVGAPEDVYFDYQPGWSVGMYGIGFEKDFNDQYVLYAMIGKTLPYVGALSVGGYYGINKDLFVSAKGDKAQIGLLAGWASPGIDLPVIDKILFAADIQTGNNVLGAAGGGLYVYFTPAIDLLTGPVFFFEKELQPGLASLMWTVQLDIDIDFTASEPEPVVSTTPVDPVPPPEPPQARAQMLNWL